MRQGDVILAAQAVCVRIKAKSGKKNTEKKIHPTQNTRRNPQQLGDRVQLETACEETHPRVRPYSPASIDPGLVEIDLVQLSQSEKATNVT